MRYIALIAVVDFLVLLIADQATGASVGGAVGALLIVLFGVPFALLFGIPLLWVARKFSVGSGALLILLGALAGALAPIPVFALFGTPSDTLSILVGACLGMVSAGLWWVLVERWPDLRAYYD